MLVSMILEREDTNSALLQAMPVVALHVAKLSLLDCNMYRVNYRERRVRRKKDVVAFVERRKLEDCGGFGWWRNIWKIYDRNTIIDLINETAQHIKRKGIYI